MKAPAAQQLATEKRKAASKKLEMELLLQIRASGWPEPKLQYKFHESRKWRFDFAWPELLLAVEVNGGTFVSGGHSRGMGQHNDYVKCGEAMALGWTVYVCDTILVRTGEALEMIKTLYNLRVEKCTGQNSENKSQSPYEPRGFKTLKEKSNVSS